MMMPTRPPAFDNTAAVLAAEPTDIRKPFLQLRRGQKHGERSLKGRERALQVVALHAGRIDADSGERTLDRTSGKDRRETASLHYLLEQRLHAPLNFPYARLRILRNVMLVSAARPSCSKQNAFHWRSLQRHA